MTFNMLDSLRNFISELTGGDKHPGALRGKRLSSCGRRGLMVHACTIDGKMTACRARTLHDVLKARFSLDDSATAELIDVGTLAENESVDLYHFTA